ncbi:alpha/beta hydrolase [Psychrobacter sp. H7-1]|uniref:alpha/beta hydrolase n=1 Tax=Psychrobacter sp. H7-1 TaxID=1569265 RepID=UPI001918E0C0|nr:alpha/beta hydrolase-fold protein [Psychrobacter sp. H7-1]
MSTTQASRSIAMMMAVLGAAMTPSHAKPDLTQTTDMTLLSAKDTGYKFVYRDFSAVAPKTSQQDNLAAIQAYAKPRHYRVWLAVPCQPSLSPSQECLSTATKVLYMLDGNAAIDDLDQETLHALSQAQSSNMAPALVFIGYQTPYRFDVDARAYDYTPPLFDDTHEQKQSSANSSKAFQEKGRARLNGGAEQFYELIEQEIKPWVYEQLGNKPTQEAIWGHSYGGLFVLYTLFKHPQSYQQYFSADPSLWWQDGEMTQYWQAFQNQPTTQLSILSTTKQLRLTFSQSQQQDAPVANTSTASTAAVSGLDKNEFANNICTMFQNNASYQFYNESHGELFTTSLLDSLQRF